MHAEALISAMEYVYFLREILVNFDLSIFSLSGEPDGLSILTRMRLLLLVLVQNR